MEEEGQASHTIEYRKMINNIEKSEQFKEKLIVWKQLVVEESSIKKKKKALRQEILDSLLNETHLYKIIHNLILKFPILNLELYFEKYIDYLEIPRIRLTIHKLIRNRFGKRDDQKS